jgi:RPA family protein
MQRAVSKKAQISHITAGKYFSKDAEHPYVISPLGEKLLRVNVIATVTDKFVSEKGNYSSITIDDGTDAIRVKVFGKNVKMFEGLEKGNLVVVIGSMAEYQNEVYLNAETVRQVSPNYKVLRSLELLDYLSEREKLVDRLRKLKNRLGENDLKEYGKKIGIEEEAFGFILESKGPDHRPKVLKIISGLDKGKGADIGKIFETSGLPDNVVESVMDELLSDGEIFEPMPGKFRVIK